VLYILLFLVISSGTTLWVTKGFRFSAEASSPVTWPPLLVGVAMAVAAVAVIFMKNRVAAILSLGIVGYGISLLFVFFRAPDLALTQLVVETVSVVLFLICFLRLPKLQPEKQSRKR